MESEIYSAAAWKLETLNLDQVCSEHHRQCYRLRVCSCLDQARGFAKITTAANINQNQQDEVF